MVKTSELILIGTAGLLLYEQIKPGTINSFLGKAGLGKATIAGLLGGTKVAATAGYQPADQAVIDIARNLGTTPWRVAQALNRSGKTPATLTLADMAGIPEVPATVTVGGVESRPNPLGPPATPDNPTGGSGTWGGLTDAQIQASFKASYGDNWRAEWQRQHDAEVRQRGF